MNTHKPALFSSVSLLLLFGAFGISSAGAAQPNALDDESLTRLTGAEIRAAFADVRDDAVVQDAQRTRAVNYWHADGRFINHWRNAEDAGEVTGTWRVEDNKRCITILSGLENRINKESCGPLFLRGDNVLSRNPDGSIHGVHSLTPLDQSNDPNAQCITPANAKIRGRCIELSPLNSTTVELAITEKASTLVAGSAFTANILRRSKNTQLHQARVVLRKPDGGYTFIMQPRLLCKADEAHCQFTFNVDARQRQALELQFVYNDYAESDIVTYRYRPWVQ